MTEAEKPEKRKAEDGAWFRSFGTDGVMLAEIHVGVEEPIGVQ